MFNIEETLRNYFTRELLHDNLSSDVALHFNALFGAEHERCGKRRGAGRTSGGAEQWHKTMERERSAEWEVAERERNGERAESAAHSLLQPSISLTS